MRTRRTRTHLQISPLAGIENDTGVLAAVTVTVTGSEGKPAGRGSAAGRRQHVYCWKDSSSTVRWLKLLDKAVEQRQEQTIYFIFQNDWPEPMEDSDAYTQDSDPHTVQLTGSDRD